VPVLPRRATANRASDLVPAMDELGNYTEPSAHSSSSRLRKSRPMRPPSDSVTPRCVRSVHPDGPRMDRASRFPLGR
jgi:hypothetical protein